jgi:hypothetical protein
MRHTRSAWFLVVGAIRRPRHRPRRQVEDSAPDLREAPEVINVLRAMRTVAVHHEQLAIANEMQNAWLREFLTRSSHARWQMSLMPRRSAVPVAKACAFFETYRLLLLPTTQFVSLRADRPFPERN